MSKEMVVFYSRADENYVNGMIKTLEVGNTKVAADIIQKLTGADMFQIEQVQPYAKGYNECIAEAQEDQKRDVRPELKAYPESIDDYDVIYLGYPNYWSTMPMAVFTFLEHFDFSGKVIRPFCTHEGSGLSGTEKDIQRAAKGALVARGLSIYGSSVDQAKPALEKWSKKD